MYLSILGYKIREKLDDAYAMFLYMCVGFLISFKKAYVVGTHLNCIDLSMQFKWVPILYAFIKK